MNIKNCKAIEGLINIYINSKVRTGAYSFTAKEFIKFVDDKMEESIPNLGLVQMQDDESGDYITVDTSSKSVRNSYSKYYQERMDYFLQSFSVSGAGTINNRTDENYVKKLLDYFKRRA